MTWRGFLVTVSFASPTDSPNSTALTVFVKEVTFSYAYNLRIWVPNSMQQSPSPCTSDTVYITIYYHFTELTGGVNVKKNANG